MAKLTLLGRGCLGLSPAFLQLADQLSAGSDSAAPESSMGSRQRALEWLHRHLPLCTPAAGCGHWEGGCRQDPAFPFPAEPLMAGAPSVKGLEGQSQRREGESQGRGWLGRFS